MFASGSAPSASLLRGHRKASLMIASRRLLRTSEKRRKKYQHWQCANQMFGDNNSKLAISSTNDASASSLSPLSAVGYISEDEDDDLVFEIPISCRRQIALEEDIVAGKKERKTNDDISTTEAAGAAVDPIDQITAENLTVTLPTRESTLHFHHLSENQQKKQEYFTGRVYLAGTSYNSGSSGNVKQSSTTNKVNERSSHSLILQNKKAQQISRVSFANIPAMARQEAHDALGGFTGSAPLLSQVGSESDAITATDESKQTLSRTTSLRAPRRTTNSFTVPSNILAGLRRLRPIVMRTVPSEREQLTAEHKCPPGQCRYVRINVAGLLFELCATYLDRHPKTLFGDKALMSGYWEPRRKEYFFDRHRPSFEGIFAFLKYGDLPRKPDGVPDDVFLDELYFFRIEDDIIDQWKSSRGIPIFEAQKYILKKEDHFFRRLWYMFEFPAHSRMSYALNIISVIAAIVAVCCLIFESMPSVSTSHCLEGNRPNFADRFFIIETTCTAWFTLELLVRVIGAPSWRDLINYQTGIDIAANTPYFVILASILVTMDCTGAKSSASTGFLRIFRLFSIFKLSDRSGAFALIANTFKASTRVLTLFFLALAVCVVLFGSFIYIIEAEGQTDEMPQSEFQSIADGFWWAVITMTTVGYGDLIPRTVAGKIVGSCCAIVGVITLSMPIPILTENFNKFYKQMKKRKSMTT